MAHIGMYTATNRQTYQANIAPFDLVGRSNTNVTQARRYNLRLSEDQV